MSGATTMVDEPISIKFANTLYAVRGGVREGVGTASDLTSWLGEHASAFGGGADVGDVDVRDFLALRNGVRTLLRAAVEDRIPEASEVRVLNEMASLAPRWPVLSVVDGAYSIAEKTDSGNVEAALAAIARDAISVLGGPLRSDVRACEAPRCVLFFVKDHPRREWCSAACGNRARVARHHYRHSVV
jgi:predicted RNA-binding Zn ribbon-like protein